MRIIRTISPRGRVCEEVTYKGVTYRRYPEADHYNARNYFKFCTTALHRVIFEEHHGPIPKGYHIHHKDGNPGNNSIDNLELLTPKQHASRTIDARPPTEKTCVFCGEKFMDWSQQRNARFCCHQHYDAQKRKEGRPRIPAKCVMCGADFMTPAWKPAKTCSWECRNKRLSESQTARAAADSKIPIDAKCHWCGKDIKVLHKKGKWCAMTCRNKYVSMRRRIATANRKFARMLDESRRIWNLALTPGQIPV